MKRITSVVVGLLLVFVGTSESFAETITVCPSGCDYTSIQDAINDSSDHDVINIAAGTYNEHSLNPGGRIITIQGTLNGDGTLATIIDAHSSGSAFKIDSGEGTGTVIKDLKLTGGTGPVIEGSEPNGGGINFTNNSNPTISGCTISGNTANAGGGIYCAHSNPIIIDCTISENTSPYNGGGIYCSYSNPTISDCTISSNTATYGYGGGISCWNSNPTIKDCMILNNAVPSNESNPSSAPGGGAWSYSSNPTISGGTISGNTPDGLTGSFNMGETAPAIGACCFNDGCITTTESDCTAAGGAYAGDSVTCADAGCSTAPPVGPCCVDLGCQTLTNNDCTNLGGTWLGVKGRCSTCPTTINVPGDYTSIQAAINAASDGDVIQVGPGTIFEGDVNPGGKAITIQGTVNSDGSLASTIDAQQNFSVIKIDNGEGPGTVIMNLILTGGAPNRGGGIYCGVGTSPVITGCLITGNSAESTGGGIHCQQSDATIINCTINNNSAPTGGGISCKGGPGPAIAYCTLMHNTADTGSGVYSDNSDPILSGISVCQNANPGSQVSGTWTDGGDNVICCPGDINGDGDVDAIDLALILGAWGVCP